LGTEKTEQRSHVLAFRVTKSLHKLIRMYLERDIHVNESDFIREAVREKIQRDAPELYKQLLEKK